MWYNRATPNNPQDAHTHPDPTRPPMFRTAVAFLMVALVAGLIGFDLLGDYSVESAKPVFFASTVAGVAFLLADSLCRRAAEPF